MKKKQDNIDRLFKDYFSNEADRNCHVSESAKMMDFSIASVGAYIADFSVKKCVPFKDQCPDTTKLGAYIDGSIDKKEVSALGSHIKACKKCLGKVREAKLAIEQFEKGTLPEVPKIISAEELSRLSKKNPRKK